MITSDGFVVPVNSDGHFRSLSMHLSYYPHVITGNKVIPVGRTEPYRKITLPQTVRSFEVYTLHTDRETAADSDGPFGALWSMFWAPEAGEEVVVNTRKFAIPVRILMEGFVGPVNGPEKMVLTQSEADKRESSAARSYAESKRQLQRDLEGIVTPDIDLSDSPIAKWAIVAGVMVAVFAVVVAARRR